MSTRPRAVIAVVSLGLSVLAVNGGTVASADPLNTATVSTAGAPTSVRTTPGRLWWVDGGNQLHARDTDYASSPAVVAGSGLDLTVGTVPTATTSAAVFSPSGDNLAYLDSAGATVHVVNVSTGAVLRDIAPPAGLTTVKLSGPRLELDTPTVVTVVTVSTGAARSFPASASLSGRYVAYFNPDGSIIREDLVTGARVSVRGSEQPSVCTKATVACSPANSPVTVKLRGDWVYWKYSCELRGENLRTGAAAVDLSGSAPCLKRFSLLDGFLVYKDSTGSLQGQDLTTGPAPVVLVTGPVAGYAVENRDLAWYNASGLHAGSLPLSGVYTPTPRLSDETVPAAFSPNGDGRLDTWLPQYAMSADVVWSLSVSGPNGPVPGSPFTGGTRYGTAAPVWAPDGSVLDGVYSWSFTASNLDGTLRGADGMRAGMDGTVVLRRSAPAVSVSAPLVSSTLRANLTIPIRFSALVPANLPGYRVISYTVSVNDNGAVRTFTTTSGSPSILGVQGHTYLIRVRANDNAGNSGAFTAPARTAVPLDDRSLALSYTGSWTAVSSTGSFLGTAHVSKIRGSAVKVRTLLSRYALIVTTCPTCGQVRVFRDGLLVTTVDTYSATRQVRRIVGLRTVSLVPAFHTLRFVVVGNVGRPTVQIDAVAAIR